MKLYDGKKMVNIEMNNWTDNGYTPDWSIDFFEAGSLEYNEDMDAYMVEDVDYCIEQARDWQNARGDFYEPEVTFADIDSRNVDVNEIKTTGEDKEQALMELADEMNEMIALGWEEEEAHEDEGAFLGRLGDYAEGLTLEEIWQTWKNVWEIRKEA